MEFKSLGSLALHMAAQEVALLVSLRDGLEKCAKKVETTARDEIGYYQSGIGPFPAWEALADATEASKSLAGYPMEAPLLATGDMRKSITHTTHALETVIGSTDEKMFYHEFGTPRMPAGRQSYATGSTSEGCWVPQQWRGLSVVRRFMPRWGTTEKSNAG